MIEEEQQSNKSSTIIVNNNKYLINEDGKTVSLVKWVYYDQIQIIPRSINYQSKEYIITNILEKAFYLNQGIKSVEFSEDSEVQTFGESSFQYSLIESISIPARLTKICKRAFSSCKFLKEVKIPSNSELKSIGDFAFINTIKNG